ncbi:ABC transporter permease [Swaminathania salitolerans]|uniref:Transport permease protein n=1 Tax=Swaminathania salitolerans TaxID=182838 RepID=A0A511BQ50_9PROT|nr:ABC transporter permease [Swaminathania salitolerans]GBQ11375.1 capsular polysaccharide ABC transporter transmembrane protein [Swaminathania salitolerans LMG 21291]GEL02450.1 transport permease protein [Swaminathania salitolerans]
MKNFPVLRGFRKQIDVINALVFREMLTRYGRGNIGFLWVIGEPVIFCVGVSVMWTLTRPAREHGLGMTALVVTGYVPLTMWRHCLIRAVKAFEANGSLLFHRQVTPLDIITARSYLEVIGTIMAGIIVWLAAIGLGFMKPPADIGLLYLGFFFQSVFCMITAFLVAALSEISDFVEKCVNIVSYLALPFSGAFIMVSWLPPKYQWILMLSPMANNIEMIRGGQFGGAASVKYNILYDAYITAALLIIALYLTHRVRKYLHVN